MKAEVFEKFVLDRRDLEILETNVLYIDDKPNSWYEDDEWFTLTDELLFDNKTEAMKEKERLLTLYEKMAEQTMKNINVLESISYKYMPASLYLPKNLIERTNDNCWFDKYNRLQRYIKDGYINVMGKTFTKENVVRIDWGKETANVILKGGKLIHVEEEEMYIIRSIFGENYSEYEHSSIK